MATAFEHWAALVYKMEICNVDYEVFKESLKANNVHKFMLMGNQAGFLTAEDLAIAQMLK